MKTHYKELPGDPKDGDMFSEPANISGLLASSRKSLAQRHRQKDNVLSLYCTEYQKQARADLYSLLELVRLDIKRLQEEIEALEKELLKYARREG
jgi:hypothetical protein